MRNVWRAPFRDTFSAIDAVFQICGDSYNFRDICPRGHSVRNVWRVSPVDSGALLGQQLGHLNRQGRPSARERCPVVAVSVPVGGRLGSQRRSGLPPRNLLRHARGYSLTSGRLSSVAGSAMHMKLPDDIGREAGIGRTRNRKELNVFRACSW